MQGNPKLLKAIYELREDKSAGIKHLVSVELKPPEAGALSFYSIANELVLAQPNFLGSAHWVIGQGIVPIVELSDDQKSVRCLGTGFYISTTGLLMTAAHILSNYLETAKKTQIRDIDKLIADERPSRIGVMLCHHQLPGRVVFEFLPMRWMHIIADVEHDPLPWIRSRATLHLDVAICETFGSSNGRIHQPLTIVQPGIKGFASREGRNVFAVGYSGMKDFSTQEGSDTDSQISFIPHVSRGKVARILERNHIDRAVPSPGPCFQLEAKISSGMSGSPVFDEEGAYVCGIASSSWQGEDGVLQSESYCSMIGPMCKIPLIGLNGRSIYEILQAGSRGMTRLMAPSDM